VFVSRHLQDKFVAAIRSHYSTYFPDGTLDTPDMSKIVNGNHHERVLNLLAISKGQTILGGSHNEDKIELTVLKDVPADDPLVKG
jgi:acyl-CoA reductase-like NAD-dependent aldehyde dehydrogenase